MTRTPKTNANRLAAFAVLLLAAGAGTATLLPSRRAPRAGAPEPAAQAAATVPVASADGPASILPSPEPQQSSDAAAPLPAVSVYEVVTTENGSRLEKTKAPASVSEAKTPEAEAALALEAMGAMGHDKSPLPEGTRVRSVAFSGGGTATVDFEPSFTKNFTGGDENEALVLNAVLATLGQFPGVERVQILVAGKKIDSLGGTQTLDEPLAVPQATAAAAAVATRATHPSR